MTNTTQSFQWGDIALSQVAYVDGIPHATRQAIGEWLEYADSQKAIDNLLDRNPHIEHYSTPLNLRAVDGKMRDVSVYHPIGFLLIVMESGQPKALACKVAVAEFVWHFAGPHGADTKERNAYIKEIERITDRIAGARNAMVYRQLVRMLEYYCHLAAWPQPDLTLRTTEIDQLALPLGEQTPALPGKGA
ncbi:hypothetical protein [Sedimenticola hydrogenitrophicus]|uniref:hypothetical protein n=1 Tax=Sedimenticola hydrogenitrophicus TaxID=2967975 RepID=UPI0023AFD8C2|nr:hypothetical protein [Sedimenticola hydrogenitrophicus]